MVEKLLGQGEDQFLTTMEWVKLGVTAPIVALFVWLFLILGFAM